MYQKLRYPLKIFLNIMVYVFMFVFVKDTHSDPSTKPSGYIYEVYDDTLKYVFKAGVIIALLVLTLIMNDMFVKR